MKVTATDSRSLHHYHHLYLFPCVFWKPMCPTMYVLFYFVKIPNGRHLNSTSSLVFCFIYLAHIYLSTWTTIGANLRHNTVLDDLFFPLNRIHFSKSQMYDIFGECLKQRPASTTLAVLFIRKSLGFYSGCANPLEILEHWHCHLFLIVIQFSMNMWPCNYEELVEAFFHFWKLAWSWWVRTERLTSALCPM